MRGTHQSHPSSTHPSCPPHSVPWDSQNPDGQPLGQTRSLPKHSTSLPSLPAIPEPGQLCSLHLPSLHTTLPRQGHPARVSSRRTLGGSEGLMAWAPNSPFLCLTSTFNLASVAFGFLIYKRKEAPPRLLGSLGVGGALRTGPSTAWCKYLPLLSWSLTPTRKEGFSQDLDFRLSWGGAGGHAFSNFTPPHSTWRQRAREGSPRGWAGVKCPTWERELCHLKNGFLPALEDILFVRKTMEQGRELPAAALQNVLPIRGLCV